MLVATILATMAPRPASAERAYGASLPEQVRPVEPGRFQSTQKWARTERWFRRVYGRSEGIIWLPLPHTSKVEGFSLRNVRAGRTWDALNVYRAEGSIHIVVLPRE